MYPAEEKELSIDTPQGLQEFLQFIEDVYRDFVVALQHTSGSEIMVSGDLLSVETAKQKAEELVTHHTKVLEFGGEIFEEDIFELQSLYDTIATAYDRLTNTAEEVRIHSRAHGAFDQTLASLDVTLDRAKSIALHADELVYEFGELETARATTPELKLGKLLFEQLKATAGEIITKVDEIEQFKTAPPSEKLLSAAQRIDDELDTFTKALEQLRISLLRFFETDNFADQTPERKNAAEIIKKNERAAKLFDQQSVFTEVLKKLLKNREVQTVLQERYSSPAAFEAALKREVYRVEAPSRLDSLLGIKHESAFAFLKDMRLIEIDELDSRPRELIRQELQQKNIPYEMYMVWMQAMPYLESYAVAHDGMTFLELFVRSEIEMLRIELEAKRNSQGVHNR
jgi:hypothetical protein